MIAQKESDGKLKWDSFLWKALQRVNVRWQENKLKYPVHNHLLPLSKTPKKVERLVLSHIVFASFFKSMSV